MMTPKGKGVKPRSAAMGGGDGEGEGEGEGRTGAGEGLGDGEGRGKTGAGEGRGDGEATGEAAGVAGTWGSGVQAASSKAVASMTRASGVRGAARARRTGKYTREVRAPGGSSTQQQVFA
jgi:hypothetical protein